MDWNGISSIVEWLSLMQEDSDLFLVILSVLALFLAKLSRILRKRNEKRRVMEMNKRYEELFGRPRSEQIEGQGANKVSFQQFNESLMAMLTDISQELSNAGIPEPESLSLQDLLGALSPESRRKLESTIGPAFTDETGEMVTQVLELFKTIMLTNYRLAGYRQKKIASHTKTKIDAAMLPKDLEVLVDGVRQAGLIRKQFESMELDGPEERLMYLITAVKYHQYVVELLEANGIADPAIIAAVKQQVPLIPPVVESEDEDENDATIEGFFVAFPPNRDGHEPKTVYRTGETNAAQVYEQVSNRRVR
jgi:hypothetical protein